MIELRKDKIWYDGLDTNPGVDRPWDSVARGLHKFICFGPGDAGASGSSGGGGPNAAPFGDVDEDLDEVAALAGGFGFGTETAPADDPFGADIEFGEPLPGMTATQAVEATSGAPAVGGLAGLSGTDFSPFPSILSFLGKLALTAIPVVGVPLATASTVLGSLGTLGKAVGSKSLGSLSELAPTSVLSSLFGKGLTSLGVPEDVVDFVSSPPINVEARPTTTDVSFFGIGRGTNNPAVSVPVGTDVITDNVPEDVTQGFSSVKSGISGFVSDVEDFFSQSVEDNPIAVTAAKATGGLVSLRDNGGPVVSDAQKAYMNWLDSVGGRQALSQRGLRAGRIDEVITPAGPEYFSYDTGESSQAALGAGMYDDEDIDPFMFPFAYPENPNFRNLNALGGGPRNIPQSVAPQSIVDVTRQSVIARRLSDEEEERLRRLRMGLPVSVVNTVSAYTGGGIQQLVNQGPTLLDVVNKGMSIPEETIPSQRPQPFIKGQQQPGGLRSTNYYTNAMQPASFYAQPQQVRNYGSIY